MNDQSIPEEAYLDRNLAVLAFARLAQELSWNVGVRIDPAEPDWPVIYVDTPQGQVSWHLPKDELIGDWPDYSAPWDGHSVEDKRKRLQRLIAGGLAAYVTQ